MSSRLIVNSIRHTGASGDAVTLANDGTCTANITSVNSVVMPNSGSLSNRNKIYNGKMEIDQRSSGSAVAIENNSTKYYLDRWSVQGSNLDNLSGTVQQVEEAPDGFLHSLKITTNTAESAIDSNEILALYQKMEGQDFQDLGYNTSGVKAITMSFWVKSSITGTFGFTVYRDESGTDRIINKTYTIDSANTWEKKTITIAGDTGRGLGGGTGARWWNVWHLAAGSDFDSATSSSWANYTITNWAGGHAQDGVVTTNGATWQITGVQLETGSVATDFEHRPYGQELALCQRYYQKIDGSATNTIFGVGNVDGANQGQVLVTLGTPLRAKASSMDTTGSSGDYKFRVTTTQGCDAVPTLHQGGFTQQFLEWQANGHGFTSGQAALGVAGSSSAFLGFSAEL